MSLPTISSLTSVAGKTQLTINYAQSGATSIQYKVDSGSYTTITTATSGSFVVSSLVGGTTYTITLNCINANGSITSTVNGTAYDVPTNATITSTTIPYHQAINVSYSINMRGSAINNIKYIIEPSGEVTTNPPNVSVGTNNPFTITGLTGGVSYYIRISGRNIAGDSSSSVAYVASTLDVPSKPTITSVVSPSNKILNINYTSAYTGASGSTVLSAYSNFSNLQNSSFNTSPMIAKNTVSSASMVIPSWTKTAINANVYVGSYATNVPLSNASQYVFLTVNSSGGLAGISQNVYLEPGNYHAVFYGYKLKSGGGDTVFVNVADSSGGVIINTIKQIISFAWIEYNSGFTITTAGTYTVSIRYTSTNTSMPNTVFVSNVYLANGISHQTPDLYTSAYNYYKTAATFTSLANNSSLTNPNIANWKIGLRGGTFYLSKGNTTYASDSSSSGYITLANNSSVTFSEPIYQGTCAVTFNACCKHASTGSDILTIIQLNSVNTVTSDVACAITSTTWKSYSIMVDVTNLPFYNNNYTNYSLGKKMVFSFASTNATQPNFVSIKDVVITPNLLYFSTNLQTSPQLSLTLDGNKSYPISVLIKEPSIGKSVMSDTYTATVNDVPSRPIVTSITATVNNQLNIYWSSAPSVGTTILDVKYSINGSSLISGGVSNPLLITGLSGGQLYSFSLQTSSIYGNSSVSSVYYGMPVIYPEKPVITNIDEPSNNTISIYWKDDNNDLLDDVNGTVITDIKYSIDNGDTYQSGGTSNPIILTGLSGGQLYLVKIKATNSAGNSIESLTGYANPYDKPDKPIITSITAPSKNQLYVYWTDSSNGAELTSIKYTLNGTTPSIDASINSPIIITGLTGGQTYQIRLMTTNMGGNSIVSDIYSAIPFDIPGKPFINSIVYYNDNYSVNWSDLTGGTNISDVLYSYDNSGTYISSGNANPTILTNLSGGYIYPVRIKLVNAAGISEPSEVYNVIPVDKTPIKSIQSPIILNVVEGNGKLTVNFTHVLPTQYPVIAYQYSLNGGQYINSNVTSSPIIINNLTNGSSYQVRIVAVNITGISEESNISLESVPHDVPNPPIINSITVSDSALLCNIQPGNNNGGASISYAYSIDGGNTFIDASSSPIDGSNALISASNVLIGELSNGTIYEVAFKQINEYGYSAPSNIKSESPYLLPSAPTITNATASATTATIFYIDTDGSANGFPIICYKYSIDNGVNYHPIYTYTSPFTVYDLTDATTYSLIMKSVTIKGESEISNEITFSTFDSFSVITAPIITNVVAGVKEAEVHFSSSTSTAPEYEFINYQYSLDGGVTFDWCVSISDSSFMIHDLTPDVSYTLIMRTYSNIGFSQNSIVSAEFTPFDRPDPPTITNIIPSDSKLLVYFQEGNDHGRNVHSHLFSLNGGDYQYLDTISSPLTITGLVNTNEYIVTIKSVNEAGASDSSAPSLPETPFGLPDSPIVTGVTVFNQSAVIDVSANLNGDSIIGFKYSFDQTTWYDASSINGASQFQIDNLTNGTSYALYVKIVSQTGTTPSSTISTSFTSKNAPSAPILGEVIANDESITVNFTEPNSNGAAITGYWYSVNSQPYKLAFETVSPITVYGLQNGTSYVVRIKAENSIGLSQASADSAQVTPAGVPDMPVITNIYPGLGNASIEFNPLNGNGKEITKIQYSTGPRWIDLSGQTSPIIVPNLVNKTNLSITIRAFNSSGASYPSNTVSVMVGTPCPPIVTNVVSGDKQLTVYFDPSNSNGIVTAIMYGFSGSNIKFAKATTATSPIIIPKLVNGTSYAVKIISVNANGSSLESNTFSPIIPAGLPITPIIGVVTRTGVGSMSIPVTSAVDNGSPITKYYYSMNTDTTLYDLSGTTSPFIVSSLSPNTSYSFKVYTQNSLGTSLGSPLSKPVINTFIPPAAPTKLVVLATNGNLKVTFILPPVLPFTPVTSYVYSLNGNGTSSDAYVEASGVVTVTSTTSSFNISISNNTDYIVRIKAVNSAGSSPASLPATVVKYIYLPPTPPVIKSISVINNSTISLLYTASTSRNSPITGYVYTLNNGSTFVPLEMSGAFLICRDLSNNIPITTFKIAANSEIGYSVLSASAATFSIPFDVPIAPSVKSVSTITNGTIGITYTAAIARNSPITGYYYTLNNGSQFVSLEMSGAILIARDLSNNVPISTLKIVANSPLGYSALSAASPIFTIKYSAPAFPVLATPIVSGSNVTINFPIPASNGSPINGFQYTLRNMNTNAITVNTITTVIPIVISNLPVANYTIVVRSINELGMSTDSVMKAFTIK